MSDKLIIEVVTIVSDVKEREANAELVGSYPFEVTLGFEGRTATFISSKFTGWSSDFDFIKDTLWGYTSDFYILEKSYEENVAESFIDGELTRDDYDGIIQNESAFRHLFGDKAHDVEDEVHDLMH